jgi:tRNA threonylcarbamoyladenosine biosynthesis protein TsaB
MRVLGIDTATWTASVGVVADDEVLAERSLAGSPTHGLSLVPLIEATLSDARLRLSDVHGLAVSIGPGSFTGLRVGLSTAKGLAFACAVPLVGVATLEALALAAETRDGFVCPMLDARKSEVYTALFRMEHGTPAEVVPACAVELRAWLPRLAQPCVFVGDAEPLLREHPLLPAGATVLPFARFHPRGSIVARLGAPLLHRGAANSELEPLYIRPSEAELKWRQPPPREPDGIG